MVGKRWAKRSSPVASSQRWSTPCSAMRAAMARLTTSRGASSSTKRSPSRSRSSAPWPRRASESSGRGMAGWCSAVGWNCTNSTSAVGTPARSAMATPSPVDSDGLVVTENSWPAPPVASTTWSARTSTGRRPAPRRRRGQRGHPHAAAALDDEVEGEPALEHGAGRAVGGVDQGPLHLGPGGGAAGVHDPRPRVPALAGQGERAAALAVELDAQGDQLVHPARALVDQDAHRLLVAQAGAGGQGVGQVQVGRVLVAAEHRGHAALGPAGGRLGQRALGQHAEREGAARPGQPHGGRQPGDAAAQDQDVERSRARPRVSRRFGQGYRQLGVEAGRDLVDDPVAPVHVHDAGHVLVELGPLVLGVGDEDHLVARAPPGGRPRR